MDGSSTAALTTFCSAISQRTISSASEVNSLLEVRSSRPTHIAQLSALSNGLQELNQRATQLEESLIAATAASLSLQNAMKRVLTSCDGSTTILHKELMRLAPQNVTNMCPEFLTAYREMLEISSGLFTYFTEALTSRREEQDARLDTNQARNLLEQADNAFRTALMQRSILKDQLEAAYASGSNNALELSKSQEASEDAEPPPYSAEPLPSPSGAESSQRSWGKSIKHSLKAFASSLQPKPEPFVSALCQAASIGDVQQIAGLLAQGANVNGRNENGKTALQCAIFGNHEDAVRMLLASGSNTTYPVWQGMPPLFLAASLGNLEVAEYFVNKGDSIEEKSISGQSYFVEVAAAGNLEGIQFLLDRGSNPNTKNISGEVVIAHAIRKHQIDIVRLLLSRGADIDSKDISGRPLLAIALEKKDLAMAELLLDHGSDPNARNIHGMHLLPSEVHNRRLAAAKLLLERGADPNGKDYHSTPVLLIALRDNKTSMGEKIDLIRDLLNRGADGDVQDAVYRTPAIRLAMDQGNVELVTLLLEHGAPTTETVSSGDSLLKYAVDQGRRDLAAVLLQHGADPNTAGQNQVTALMQSVLKQDLGMIRLLREAGADTSAPEVVDFARALRRADIFEALGMEDDSLPPAYQHDAATASQSGAAPLPGYNTDVKR